MPDRIPEPFHPGYQYDALALLLQRPALYAEYNDCWVEKLFDDFHAQAILRHWLTIQVLGSVPTRTALEHSLRLDTPRGQEAALLEPVLDLVDKLFNREIKESEAKFILRRLENAARDYNVITAAGHVLDAVQSGQYEVAAALLSRAVSTGSRSVKLAGDEWYETEPRLEKELIKGVLRRGYTGIINAPSKSHKTYLALQCGVAVTEGRSWLGFAALPPARVLYVNLEVNDEEFKVRVDQVARALGTSRKALKGRMDFLHLKGFECGLGKITAALRRLQKSGAPWELIIVDPVYKLLTAGVRLEADDQSSENIENNNTLVSALFCSLEELVVELKAAIVLVHHFKKGNAAETAVVDSGAGAGVFGRAPDVIFSLHPARDEKDEEMEDAYVVKSKLRYFRKLADFGIRLDPDSLIFHRDVTINPANIAGKAGRPQLHHIGKVLVILQGQTFTYKQWKDRAKDQYGIHPDRMGIFRDEAMDKSYVMASGPTSSPKTTYTITSLGEEAILQANLKVAQNSYLGEKMREMKARMEGNGN